MDFRDILMIAATQGGGAAAAATLGNELWVQPAFDASTGITLNGWTVSGGEAIGPANTNLMSATALETITAGTYQFTTNTTANPNGNQLQIFIGGAAVAATNGSIGSETKTVIVATVTDQLIRMRDGAGEGGFRVTSLSVKRLG
jgi:hypothetical protein